MTEPIVFAEPPALKRGGRMPDPKWAEIAAQLSQRPGEWALIKTALASKSTASDIVARINRGAIEAFAPAGTFEATMRTDVDVFNVYARRATS